MQPRPSRTTDRVKVPSGDVLRLGDSQSGAIRMNLTESSSALQLKKFKLFVMRFLNFFAFGAFHFFVRSNPLDRVEKSFV